MRLNVLSRYYRKCFDADQCKQIIDIAENQNDFLEAGTGETTPDGLKVVYDYNKRNCKTTFLLPSDDVKWIYERVQAIILDCNKKAGWDWHISQIEPIQISKYDVGDHYDWHVDGESDHSGKNEDGLVRKISCTINLSDPYEDYDDGDLEFAFPCHPGEYSLENQIIRDPRCRSKGIGIVFPSFRSHRVTPVTRGVRYSLVAWALGNPFT